MECSHVCGGFTFLSYLILPVKRMGRVRLLLENAREILDRNPSPKKVRKKQFLEVQHFDFSIKTYLICA
jgi:hypothetical protein